jgi:hypothetical protein
LRTAVHDLSSPKVENVPMPAARLSLYTTRDGALIDVN